MANPTPLTTVKPGEQRTDTWSELLGRVGEAQDQHAFKQLFDHFAPLIKGFCLNNTNQSFGNDAAEEIVQEVMLKVWQKAPSYDPSKAAASTWIYTVMRNARIDMMRRNKRHQIDNSPIEVDDLWDEDSTTGPVVQFQRLRDEEVVQASFKILPNEQRQALTEVYMKGKSHSEVASETGLPLGTVKSRVRMGLQKLQAHIAGTAHAKVQA
ncbi:sigma-70 family RNA polymerase sigma factor [Marinagarivorans algicola]|uniref:sigma-70 family RNA polymerase sigma factor n=1 Tax=Marinagarivorans algicola TaxID=1513270 RepID=UPI0006B510EA|nr:sigma-70 family RNA polymerase sigma factor [Marinagarivorans algicola]